MITTQHIYLSPHFDDAVLSCGGQIALRVAAGETVVVATVFGGKPNYDHLSPLAREIHARCRADDDLVETRRSEDRAALAILGALVRQGDYLDAIYRQDSQGSRWLYTTMDELLGQPDPADEPLVKELARVFTTLAPASDQCTLYAPLAVGNHVDHQLVRRAAMMLTGHGYRVRFYEDFPYVTHDPAALEAALSMPDRSRWQAEVILLSEASLQRRLRAIQAYRSQLAVIFDRSDGAGEARAGRDWQAMVTEAAAKVAASVGKEAYAERIWCLANNMAEHPA